MLCATASCWNVKYSQWNRSSTSPLKSRKSNANGWTECTKRLKGFFLIEDKLPLKWCNRSISVRSVLFARSWLERCQLYVSCPIRSQEALNLQPSSCATFRRVVVNKAQPWAISFNGDRQFGLGAYFFSVSSADSVSSSSDIHSLQMQLVFTQ